MVIQGNMLRGLIFFLGFLQHKCLVSLVRPQSGGGESVKFIFAKFINLVPLGHCLHRASFGQYPMYSHGYVIANRRGIIIIYSLAFLPGFLPGMHNTLSCCSEVFASMYITYILVSKSTPLAVTGPYGPLASFLLPE